MSEKQNKKTQKKQKEVKVTKEVEKEIVKKHIDKIETQAKKVALKAMTELQLATQVELSEDQKQAAKLLGSGLSHDEVAQKLGKKRQEVVAWSAQPSFLRAVNESTIKEGLSDKNERIRKAKRIAEAISDKMLDKIENGELDNMPVSVLSQLAMNWSTRVDTLVDKREAIESRDLTVLILNHIQDGSNKKYNKIEDFLDDEDIMYPTLDTIAVEVKDQEE